MERIACAAILFDLDGVLVDSTASVERHWRAWADRHGLDIGRILEIAHGRRTVETMRLVAPGLAAEGEARALDREQADDTAGVAALPGAAALLAVLPPERWTIVTSGPLILAVARLQAACLPRPSTLVTADDVRNGKPDPEGYLKAATALGVAPRACAVVEDAPPGIAAARAARMTAIAVRTTHDPAALRAATFSVHTLDDVHLDAPSPDRRGDLVLKVRTANDCKE